MNKLSKKFILGIIIILLSATGCSILFNMGFVEKYYLFQKKNSLHDVCTSLSDELDKGTAEKDVISRIENSEKVIVVQIDNSSNLNNNMLNDELRQAFQFKGIGFQKYWLWEGDYEKILEGESRIRLYNQEKLNYSLLVEYMPVNSQLFAITMIIPNIGDAFGIINSFLISVNIATTILIILFIFILIRKITDPLNKFKDFAWHMTHHEFSPLDIHTHDELEEVAENLNAMGNQIISYQSTLQKKNSQMEQLLDDVAHELKTPISLVKLYAEGIKDGLDDGTFLQTIIQENSQMDQIVNRLLFLTRIDKENIKYENCCISDMLIDLVKEYSLMAAERRLVFQQDIEQNIYLSAHNEWILTIFSNLLTNALKYSSGKKIPLSLHLKEGTIIFSISNQTENQDLDISKIWNPYYVGEASRNKHLSGTGLGLSIVQKLTEKLNYDISCTLTEHTITFTLRMPICEKLYDE